MLKFLTAVAFLMLFGLPVSAQEKKAPEPPDYTNWEFSGWDFGKVLYKGKIAWVLDEHYEDKDSKSMILVYYKPVSRAVYDKLDSLTPDKQDRQVHALAGKTPLFLVYYENKDDGKNAYIYDKDKRWFEFYRFGKSGWRLFIKINLANPDEVDKLIEQRYKIKSPS